MVEVAATSTSSSGRVVGGYLAANYILILFFRRKINKGLLFSGEEASMVLIHQMTRNTNVQVLYVIFTRDVWINCRSLHFREMNLFNSNKQNLIVLVVHHTRFSRISSMKMIFVRRLLGIQPNNIR